VRTKRLRHGWRGHHLLLHNCRVSSTYSTGSYLNLARQSAITSKEIGKEGIPQCARKGYRGGSEGASTGENALLVRNTGTTSEDNGGDSTNSWKPATSQVSGQMGGPWRGSWMKTRLKTGVSPSRPIKRTTISSWGFLRSQASPETRHKSNRCICGKASKQWFRRKQ